MQSGVLYKIGIKLLLLAALLVGMNFVYKKFWFEEDLQKYSDIINQIRELPLDADVLYIGESSNITYLEEDEDKRSISEFIGEYLPALKVADITKPASHAGIYIDLLKKIPLESEITAVVVTLNMRSFNAQWIYSDLETPLQKSLVLLQNYPPLVNRLFLSFQDYDIKSISERERQFKEKWVRDEFNVPFDFPHKHVSDWDYWQATHPLLDSTGKEDQAKTILACQYIKTYGFQIDTVNNPRIHDFDEIIELAKERNWNLVFNLMAENVTKAEILCGKEIGYFMRTNRTILVNYFGKKGIPVVDNLEVVPNELYVDKDFPTEHYAEQGRKDIAKNVAAELQGFYK
jgi:hypothetical protein